ncbi:MAG: DUF5131 family protein [Planctomycetaceae bacterium]
MGENSKIEWTDHTFNPWIGCTKVAEGCKHCYAEALAKRTASAQWGPEGTRVVTSDANWKQPLKWNREAEQAGVRAKVFCASMADVFEDWQGAVSHYKGDPLWIHQETSEWVELRDSFPKIGFRKLTLDDVRRRLFKLIDQTPNLDWLLLTKRPENIGRMWPKYELGRWDSAGRELPTQHNRKNVWLGTSIAHQWDVYRNLPFIMNCRALTPVLFLSMEPLLEAVTLTDLRFGDQQFNALSGDIITVFRDGSSTFKRRHHIDWVIVGGESGQQARPMSTEAVTKLQEECAAYRVPFFFKQWGGKDKKAAGRELDGKTYSEFPKLHMNQPWKGER